MLFLTCSYCIDCKRATFADNYNGVFVTIAYAHEYIAFFSHSPNYGIFVAYYSEIRVIQQFVIVTFNTGTAFNIIVILC